MTDYYALGEGSNIDGPYTLDDARKAAANMAANGERHVHIVGTVETVKGTLDDELREDYKEVDGVSYGDVKSASEVGARNALDDYQR